MWHPFYFKYLSFYVPCLSVSLIYFTQLRKHLYKKKDQTVNEDHFLQTFIYKVHSEFRPFVFKDHACSIFGWCLFTSLTVLCYKPDFSRWKTIELLFPFPFPSVTIFCYCFVGVYLTTIFILRKLRKFRAWLPLGGCSCYAPQKKFGGAYSRRVVRPSVSPSARTSRICVRPKTLFFEVGF
jgi:hypothetical protein